MSKYYKDTNGQLYVDPILEKHQGLVEITQDEFMAIANPPKTAEQIAQEEQKAINTEAQAYLDSTDWYVIRQQETGVAIPQEVLDARANARLQIVPVP